jgi:hypothetical protein
MSTKRKPVRQLSDGTMQTQLAVYTQPWATRVAIVNAIVGNEIASDCYVEIELRTGRIIHCTIVTAALSSSGTTSDLIVVRLADELLPRAYSLALVRSISQLTVAEWARRVQAS